jgi:hypothetical protein
MGIRGRRIVLLGMHSAKKLQPIGLDARAERISDNGKQGRAKPAQVVRLERCIRFDLQG